MTDARLRRLLAQGPGAFRPGAWEVLNQEHQTRERSRLGEGPAGSRAPYDFATTIKLCLGGAVLCFLGFALIQALLCATAAYLLHRGRPSGRYLALAAAALLGVPALFSVVRFTIGSFLGGLVAFGVAGVFLPAMLVAVLGGAVFVVRDVLTHWHDVAGRDAAP